MYHFITFKESDNEMLPGELTVLFNIVIWIIVATPGGYLGGQMQGKIVNFALTMVLHKKKKKEILTGITLGLLERRSRDVT